MLFDMFDKLDDIIYEPIETCCEWTKEPLKRWEHEREQQAERNRVENEIYRQQQEMQLAQWDAEKRMELEQAQARANIELYYFRKKRLTKPTEVWYTQTG